MKFRIGLLSVTLAAIAAAVLLSRAERKTAAPTHEELAPPATAATPLSAPSPPPLVLAPRVPEPTPRPSASAAAIKDEAAFMRDLRALADMDAELTIERAREGGARFGASADAAERRSILIHALARMGLASEARGEAESMVNECPDSSWVREVERFTGAHRRRNIRLAANGQLEYW